MQQRPQDVVAVAVVEVVRRLGLEEDGHAPGWEEAPQPAHTGDRRHVPHATRHRQATAALLRWPPAQARLATRHTHKTQLQA